jgi:hypothetical protein
MKTKIEEILELLDCLIRLELIYRHEKHGVTSVIGL